ncbi:MAG: ATP-binding cassette domain-containing protein [Bacteriovoracaceae bacterium]
MENSDKPIFECSNLLFGYGTPLTQDLSFTLSPGQVAFIKGANGSGKTTLIHTILGKKNALGGSYKWNIDKSFVSYLPQMTNPNSNFSFTVTEIFDFYDIPEERKSLLPKDLFKKRWIDMSGGEKQKVMLLTRLTKNIKVLILDEPFNHLDRDSINSLSELLTKLVSGNDPLSLLLVSHLEVCFPSEILKQVELQ